MRHSFRTIGMIRDGPESRYTMIWRDEDGANNIKKYY